MNALTFTLLLSSLFGQPEPDSPTAAKEAAASAASAKATDAREKVKAAKAAYDAAVLTAERAEKTALRADSDWRDALAKDATDRATLAKAAAERAMAKATQAETDAREAERVALEARRRLSGDAGVQTTTAPPRPPASAPNLPPILPPKVKPVETVKLPEKIELPSQKAAPKVQAPTLPANAARVILKLPEAATVFVNGQSYGSQTTYTFNNLSPNDKEHYCTFTVLAAGQTTTRRVTLQVGQVLTEDFTKAGP